jgi:HAD superfamily hydrolase (TIGR01458 family)
MANAVLLDIDGVLTVSWRPLPGAVEAIRWLQHHQVDFRLVTNTSSRSRQEIAELLTSAGMEVAVTQIQTAVTSAAHYLGAHHPDTDCLVVNEGDLRPDLGEVRLAGAGPAGVVLLGGAGPSVGYVELNTVFRYALEGVPVVGLHRNTRYQTADGPALDMGAFIAGIEAAAGIEVVIVGKPAPAFFEAALRELGAAAGQTIMVGDDIESDVLGAQAVGITGVLVKTGKFRHSDLLASVGQPEHLMAGIGDLPELLGRLG